MRGDVTAGEVIAFWLPDDVVTAMNVNIRDVADQLHGLVASARPVNPALLADPDLALDRLVPVAG